MSATRALTSALSYLLHLPELGSLHPCLGTLGCLWFPVPPPSLEQHVRGLGEIPGFHPWDICFSPSAWGLPATSPTLWLAQWSHLPDARKSHGCGRECESSD